MKAEETKITNITNVTIATNKTDEIQNTENNAKIRCEKRILFVLKQFQMMGGSDSDIRLEETRLKEDAKYYENWCENLSWCSEHPF